ncbi:MAG: oligopeptidase A [Sulfurimonas sp.]|jgi:oligopeptidase A|uniref:M3 family metallopeptidase n=1 Tax=Sulfurimonas sp. TaxID=2022749 RepID=UPI0039E25BBC
MKEFLEFTIDLDTFIEELQNRLTANETKVQELLAQTNKSYANFVKPLQIMDEYLGQFFTPLSHINSVSNTDKTQKVYSDALPIITEYSTKLSQNLEIYKVYKEIEEKEKGTLNFTQNRVIELNIEHFEHSGAHLDDTTKERLQEINIRKSELSNNFSQNLLDATNAYEYIISDKKDVEGLPESDIANAEFDDEGVVKYKFTLQMPSYIAYMTYGKNAQIRETLYKAYVTRCPENAAIIDEILALKNEMSQLLGFDSYAAYSLAGKMAEDEGTVLGFLEDLIKNSKAQAKVELAEVQSIAPKALQSFDSGFYSEILKKEKYDIDEEEYRPYFEQQSVVKGTFEFLHSLFGIRFEKLDEKLWDEKATSYNLYVENKLTARLYMDLEARKAKSGGAWMHNWQAHCTDEDGKEQLASAFVVCNFPASSATTPSLLRHDDVVTLFHEMGHAIHHMLSSVDENEVSGVNGVEWDAVEFPSQFLENFAYEPKVLKLFALHHESKEIIPDTMIEKLVKSKNFLSASGMLRQLEFSIFDFRLHMKVHSGDEVQNLLNSIRKDTALIQTPSYNKFQNGFAHIFAGGYAAGYYSYKWAEVLSADAFFSVVDEGIFDSKTAKKYLDIVLRGGGSKSMSSLFKELMGREPNPSNLLRLNGIS